MSVVNFIFLFYLTQCTDQFTNGLEIVPEKGEVSYFNKKYVSDAKIFVRRYNRKSKYTVNVNFTNLDAWGTNVLVNIICYEFLHNEYKRSFIELHYNFCTILEDRFFGPPMVSNGVTCPLKPGSHQLTNMSVSNVEDFPYVWPFTKGKIEIILKLKATDEVIGIGNICLLFKEAVSKKKP